MKRYKGSGRKLAWSHPQQITKCTRHLWLAESQTLPVQDSEGARRTRTLYSPAVTAINLQQNFDAIILDLIISKMTLVSCTDLQCKAIKQVETCQHFITSTIIKLLSFEKEPLSYCELKRETENGRRISMMHTLWPRCCTQSEQVQSVVSAITVHDA